MAFTLRQLEIFVEAASDENFRKTADRLGMAQPSVSNHIRALEAKTGGRLFERHRGSAARLSAHGRDLLGQAKALLQAARTVGAPGAADQSREYTLRIATGSYLADNLIRPNLGNYHAAGEMPNVELIRADSGADVLAKLRRGEAELGFYTGAPIDDVDFPAEVIREVSVGLYTTPTLAASVGSDPRLIGLAPMVMPPLNSAANGWMTGILAQVSVVPTNVVSRSEFPDVLLGLTVQGKGIALLFDEDASPHVSAGRLVRLALEFSAGWRCLMRKRAPLEPCAMRAAGFWRHILKGGEPAEYAGKTVTA